MSADIYNYEHQELGTFSLAFWGHSSNTHAWYLCVQYKKSKEKKELLVSHYYYFLKLYVPCFCGGFK